ncbi:uncharacterized protein LOC121871363 [Homarus americanus]|uniref:uncharacterized protein LOC121871363 n=1 Tax=Homarus americanus TaxID=6706 RepID=UPI001C440117|nr:uncharacterized protein LOC121871363 [Homarus americanus]
MELSCVKLKNKSSDCCMMMLLALTASNLAGGIVMCVTQGYSDLSIGIMSCGGVAFFVVLVITFTKKPTSVPSPGEQDLSHDLPPSYRNSWRFSYLKNCPAHLKEELEDLEEPGEHKPRPWTCVTKDANNQTTDCVYVDSELLDDRRCPQGSLSSLSAVTGDVRAGEEEAVHYDTQPDCVPIKCKGGLPVIPGRAMQDVILQVDDDLPTYDEAAMSAHLPLPSHNTQ